MSSNENTRLEVNDQDEEKTNSSSEDSEPNSKYRYFILLASFLTLMVTLGIARSSVIYLTVFKEYFNLNETKTAAFIFTPLIFSGFLAPFVSILCSKVKVKFIIISFTIVASISQFSGILFFNQPDQFSLFLTLITISGALYGALLIVVPLEINNWFSPNNRVAATALAFTGSSVGALFIGPVFSKILGGDQDGNNFAQSCAVSSNSTVALPVQNDLLVSDNLPANMTTNTNPDADNLPIWYHSFLYLSILQSTTLLIVTILFFLPIPKNTKNYSEKNQSYRPGFKVLLSYKMYIIFLISQFFYVAWRSGYLNFLVKFSEETACFSFTKAGYLLTFEAAAEVLFRPSIGRFAQGKNLYGILAVIFFLQASLTWVQPYFIKNYYLFATNVALIGALQGGSGGLFMQTITESTSISLARYAYAMNSAIGVFYSGGFTPVYGLFGDAFEGVNWIYLEEYYIFYLSGMALFLASGICLYGSFELSKQKSGNS